MLELVELLLLLGGIARSRQLQKHGFSRHRLATAVTTGEILRVRSGVYAVTTVASKLVTAALHGGALTCADALRSHGVWVLPKLDSEVHVWLGGSGRRHPHADCRCIIHYSPGTAPVGPAPVVAALIHAYRCLTPEAFFAAYESAWNKRLLSAKDRRRIRHELPKAARWMLDLAVPHSESGLESLLRIRLHVLGLTLESQVSIDGVGRVDFVVGARVILEADGKDNHESSERRHHDLVRDAAASVLGYETLRFDYAMIVHEWGTVAEAILAAVGRAGA